MTLAPSPWPIADAVTEPFWQGCRDGQLLLQHCESCGAWQFYPRVVCVTCMATAPSWKPASGLGTVYSTTVARRAVNPAFADRVPIVVALIDLDEGPRMLTNIVAGSGDVTIGDRVRVVFIEVDSGVVLPMFEAIEEERAAHE
jgi:uncharacterized OB-fold protein